jgi:hypothetical protein
MGIIKRIINKRNLKAWEKLQKEALQNLKKHDPEKDSFAYKYWDWVYHYYTIQCFKCRSKM